MVDCQCCRIAPGSKPIREAGPSDRRLRRGVHSPRPAGCRGTTACDDSWHRRDKCDGTGRGDRRSARLRPRTGPRCLARARAAAGDHGRQAAPARHHLARQQVPSQAADPWCPRGPADAGPESEPFRRLAACASSAGPHEHHGRGTGQQARPDRLGGSARRAAFRDGNELPDGLSRHRQRSGQRGLQEVDERWPDSRSATRQPGSTSGASTPFPP